MATTAKRKDKTAAKKKDTKAAGETPKRAARPRQLGPADPVPEFFHKMSREKFNDLQELTARMLGSPGFALLLEVLDDADRLGDKLHDLLRGHGPGTGSPLSRYVARYSGGYLWDELRALGVNLNYGTGTARSELPGVP